MSEFTVLATAEEVAEAAAAEIADALRGGAQTLVLAGGTTPKRCYELLAELDVQWGRVSVLFGDERCVPPDHPDSNYRMVKESLLDRVAPATVYRMPAELGPDEGADAYAEVVANVAPLDLVLLGVGEDGHVASLFPGHPLLGATGLVFFLARARGRVELSAFLLAGVIVGAFLAALMNLLLTLAGQDQSRILGALELTEPHHA